MTLGTLMRGRDHELGLVLDMIRAAEAGRGGVLLVEGEPGIGKSHLRRESAGVAVGRGFSVVSGSAEWSPDPVPASGYLPPLWAPLAGHFGFGMSADPGISDPGQPIPGRPIPGQPIPVPPEGRGPAGKAPVVFDDLHSARPLTLRRLRGLGQELPGLAAGAGGNPLLVVKLLAGLQDEDRIRIASGSASLLSRRLPRRVRTVVRRWLLDLSPRVRQFLEVGAVLGRSFQLDTVASLLGETPAGMLPELEAALTADLGVLLRGRDRFGAVRSLEESLTGYEKTGALRDGRRVRRRLRGLGIRRRCFTYANRPRSGWASLTDTERVVSGLVAQGLTNQQVAAQMFLSAHTVAFHLRQVYRKLDIGPRVDLARILTERSNAADSPQAS